MRNLWLLVLLSLVLFTPVVGIAHCGDGDDGATGECSQPAAGCPCRPDRDTECCRTLGHGLRCRGTANPQWTDFDGCPCVDNLDRYCPGESPAPTCPGTDGL